MSFMGGGEMHTVPPRGTAGVGHLSLLRPGSACGRRTLGVDGWGCWQTGMWSEVVVDPCEELWVQAPLQLVDFLETQTVCCSIVQHSYVLHSDGGEILLCPAEKLVRCLLQG